MADEYAAQDPLAFESTRVDHRSVEYCSYISKPSRPASPFRFMGNVRNDGYITNLPDGCCVEVPAFADDAGLHPTVVGDLPPQCAALCMTNVNVQMLAADAALNGDPERLVQAVALDPLTCAVCTLGEIREMCAEMLEAQRAMAAGVRGQEDRAEAGDLDSRRIASRSTCRSTPRSRSASASDS